MSDTVAPAAYYSAIIDRLTDVFRTPVFRTRRGTVTVTIDGVSVNGAFTPNQQLNFYAMTRRTGGPWLGVLFRLGQVNPAAVPGQNAGDGDWYVHDDLYAAAMLDETVVIAQNLDLNGAVAAAASLVDIDGNGVALAPVGGLAGGHGNLFSVQSVAQPLPGQPFALKVVDDPDIAGHFLATWSPSTAPGGAALSLWSDVGSLPQGLSAPLITATTIGDPAASMLPVAKAPMVGGTPGVAPTPITFRLTVQ